MQSVIQIRVRKDPFHFGGSKKSAKIMENSHNKISQNHKNIEVKKSEIFLTHINEKTNNFYSIVFLIEKKKY